MWSSENGGEKDTVQASNQLGTKEGLLKKSNDGGGVIKESKYIKLYVEEIKR